MAGVAFVLGAFYSGSETAFIAADRIRLRHLAHKKNRRAQLALRYMDDPEHLLSAVLVGTNLAVIGCTAAFTAIATRHYGESGSTVATLVLVPAVLIFNEVIPKGLFLHYANRATLVSVGPLHVLSAIFYPVIKLLSSVTHLLTHLLPEPASGRRLNVTMEELLFHIGDSRDAGLISPETMILAKRAVELRDLRVADVMKPIDEAVMIDHDATMESIAHVFEKEGFSRLPVRGSGGEVVGIVSVHEVLKARSVGELRKTLIPPQVVTTDAPIVDVLFRMKDRGRHMAVVQDEAKKTVGMTTMEDILEKFVGAIADEFN
jgi:putative hemolysin